MPPQYIVAYKNIFNVISKVDYLAITALIHYGDRLLLFTCKNVNFPVAKFNSKIVSFCIGVHCLTGYAVQFGNKEGFKLKKLTENLKKLTEKLKLNYMMKKLLGKMVTDFPKPLAR